MTTSQNSPIVVGLGEILWDVFPDEKRPGGAPANVAFQVQQLGGQGVIVSRIGTDPSGDELLAFLESKGLQTSAIQRDPTAPTGRVTVSFNEQNQPEYVIHEGVAWDNLEFHDELSQLMQKAKAVCFWTLAQRCEKSRTSIQQAVRATSPDCLRVYDVNIRQDYYEIAWIEASLKLANIIKLNDEEVELLAPLLGLPSDFQAFCKELIQKFELNLVCITRGANGCLLSSQDETVDVAGEQIQVADTVGAGDAFTAGLIVSQLQGKTLKVSGQFANKVGGIVASHHGAMPELKDVFANL